ncbi:SDR family NAD(P)-dependent oxidoreductase [Vreelandella aquamarina]
MTKRVAIIGAAHRFPGTTPETFWQDLQAEKDFVTQVAPDRWSQEAFGHPNKRNPGTSVSFAAGSLGDISGFDPEFFGISPREAANMDPQQRMLLELAWEAVEDAGIQPSDLRGSQCGVFLGVASLDYSYRMADDMAAIDASTATGNTSSIASNRVSYVFDLHGPSMSLDTACSSSMVAFHQACQAIRSGETNMALAGGISLHLHPYGFIIFSKASMLSPTGRCQVFDEAGNGYVRSEGAGLFMLKDYDDALADGDHILAVVAGSAVNTDGHKSGLTVPNPSAQIDLMRRAYEQAGITPDEIDYLEAHGTGTAVGDPIESRAIGEALGKHRQTPLPIGSIKSNLGHLETASGVAGLAKALYSLKHREVPATIGIRNFNPKIKFDEWNIAVVTKAQALKKHGRLVIGVNSFGFGGANAHVILESPPDALPRTEPALEASPEHPLPIRISGRSDEALADNAERLVARLRDGSSDAFYDIAHTLYQHREHHSKGALVFAHSAEQAAEALAHFVDGSDAPDDLPAVTTFDRLADAHGPVFVYDGNGCQWEAMGRDLLERDATFAAALEQVDQLFEPLGGFSLRKELNGENGTDRLERTEIAQPALFGLQVAVTLWLEEHGVRPAAVFGHSVGEVAAAWASGALSLGDAVNVIHYRSHYQGKTRGQGQMTAVALGADAIQEWLEQPGYRGICLAGINSPNGVTLAGDPLQLTALETALGEQSIFAKRLPLDYAFHSPAMDAIQSGVIEALSDITPRKTRIPYISTVSGEQLDGQALDATYWWKNIREPVRFHAAANALVTQGFNVFVEIGAHPILRRYLSDALREEDTQGIVLSSVERDKSGPECMTLNLGKLLLSGVAIDTKRFFPVEGQRVSLPRYAWQRQSLWVTPSSDSQGLLNRYYQHPLLGYPLAQQERTWESQLDVQRQPWLSGHVVGEGAVFPGAGFVELALAAALQRQDTPQVDIEELEIRAPLLLDTPHGRMMRLHIGEHDGRMEIRSREPAVGQEWQLNAVARMLQETGGSLLKRTAPRRPERSPDYTLDQHLSMAEHLGLHYQGAFQAIRHGWIESDSVAGDSVIGEVVTNDALQASQQGLYLHPGILDSAFQMFIPLLARHGNSDSLAFVPVRVGRIQLDTQAGPPTLARAVMGKRAPHSFTADFELYDASGNAVAVLSEVRFKAIRLNRTHDQTLSYLDVQLTPAPLENNGFATPDDAMERLGHLISAYSEQTGERYANEVAPLLDRLSEAFSEPESDDGQPTPQAIWQLLVQEYPDYFAPVHLVGRLGLHREALRAGAQDIDNLGISDESLSRLNRVLIGESGWQSIAQQLTSLLDNLLENQPAGQRLQLLEAGCCVPALGERLLEHLAHPVNGGTVPMLEDTFHQRIVATTDASLHQAEQLQERYPLLDIHSLDSPLPTLNDGDKAQLALVSLDVTHPERTFQLLESLPALLAPGAQVLLLGVHPGRWTDDLLATPGIDRQALEPAMLSQWLTNTGWLATPPTALEGSDNGAYLIHATALQENHRATYSPTQRHLLIAAHSEDPLASSLVASLEKRGDPACLIVSDAPASTLLDEALTQTSLAEWSTLALNVVDLRGRVDNDDATSHAQTQRCELAREWTLTLEEARIPSTLWLTTQGVSALWQPASGQLASSVHTVPQDAALWGFGRSLANEAAEHNVNLIDLPTEPGSAAINALAASLSTPDAENEIVISAQGHRFATRLRTLTPPNPDQMPTQPAADASHQAMTLGFAMPGQLRQLQWRPRTLPALGAEDVEVKVKATGLNFRDVMYTLGLLSDEAIENGFAGPTLGLEFAGEVAAVGDTITHLKPGDAVVGFGPASFSDRLVASQYAVAPLPEGISYSAAATIPTTFFTVYYALKHLARLEPGEKVLIHGAAGGVGIAALQIAQWLGAEIYATVGSQEKRDFLRLMGIHNLYDSRSLTFAEEILQDTNGEGVDVVLNSLAGEAINQNLRALRPFGRFLELGKRDFYENTHIGLRPFRNNLSYFGIDSDQLMKVQPALTQRLFTEMMALFNDGTLSPLPFTAFNHSQVIDAFRYMQQARQIGKVVVTYEQPIAARNKSTLGSDALRLPGDASYLVTGGLGGFGLKTAQWLVDKGAKALILLSRSGPASEEAQSAVAAFEAQGVNVLAAACDITDREALADVLAKAHQTLPPLHGIVHAATVIDDSLIRNLDAERIHKVLAPKIDGARHLDALTRDCPLDFFVVYSSATTLFGNPGQANYVAANHWLEAFAAARRQRGQPATCVRWGAIEDVGFLARNTRTRDALQERLGGSALRSDDALNVLEQMLLSASATSPSLGVLELEWGALARFLPTAGTPRFMEIARISDDDGQPEGDSSDIRAMLETLSPDELHAAVTDLLRAELASILLIEEDKIDTQRSVYEMGFDSLMGVELMTAIESRLGVSISVMVLSEASTLDKLATVLIQKMQHSDVDVEEAPQDALASLAARHGAEGLQSSPQVASSSSTQEAT